MKMNSIFSLFVYWAFQIFEVKLYCTKAGFMDGISQNLSLFKMAQKLLWLYSEIKFWHINNTLTQDILHINSSLNVTIEQNSPNSQYTY